MRETFSEQPDSKEKFKQWGRVGVAAAVLLYGGLAEQRRVEAQSLASSKAVAERQGHKISKETLEVSEAEARSGLLTDEVEQNFVRTNLDRPGYLKRIGTTGEASGFVEDDDIAQLVNDSPDITEIELSHTHELNSYRLLLSSKIFASLRNRQREPVPMAPSMTDYFLIAHFQELYKNKGIVFKGKVIAIHGQFTYTVDVQSRFFRACHDFKAELEKKYAKHLTAADKEILAELHGPGMDDRLILPTLSDASPNDPRYKQKIALAQKLETLTQELIDKYGNDLQAGEDMEALSRQIVQTDPRNKDEIHSLITELQKLCVDNGVRLDYKEM